MNYYGMQETLSPLNGVDFTNSIFTFLGAYLGVVSIVSLIIYVLQVVAWWKLFEKAGEAGWKSIIPIYNTIVLYKISGVSPWLILVAALVMIIPFVGVIASACILIYQIYMLAKSFGKGVGYTILLVLPITSTIAHLVLGLGDAKYVGPAGKKAA